MCCTWFAVCVVFAVHMQVGSALTAEQLAECEALGILVDKDDQGVLLQIFTKPLGERMDQLLIQSGTQFLLC